MALVVHTSQASAKYLEETMVRSGALVVGRRVFDYANGWGGEHPLRVPIFVVTHGPFPRKWIADHPEAQFKFVTEGVETAIDQAKTVAGDKTVGVNGPNIAEQWLNAGLLDEVHIDLVPVLLGKGIRFCDDLRGTPTMFEDPDVIDGNE